MSASFSPPPALDNRPEIKARPAKTTVRSDRHSIRVPEAAPSAPAWWEGLFQADDLLRGRTDREGEARVSDPAHEHADAERMRAVDDAAAIESDWDLSASATGVGDRIEYAQAQTGQTDDASRVNVSKLPPWTVAVGGLLAGAAVVALGGGSEGIRQLSRSWTQGDLSVTAEPGSRTVIDAAGLRAGPPTPKLTLTGPGAVEVLGLKVDSEIIASNLLTGTLRVTTANDSAADRILIATGSGDTTIELADNNDVVEVDAAKLTGLGKLTVSGQVQTLVVSNLTAILDTSALTGNVIEVYTGAVPVPKTLASGPIVQVVTGVSNMSIDSDRAEETVKVSAGKMPEGGQLTTTGDGRFQVLDFAANLVNRAAGGIEVTLGNTGTPLIGAVTIASATRAVVYNGLLGDADEIMLMELAPGVEFVVNGLKAGELDARATSGHVRVTTADVSDNILLVRTGTGDMNIDGRSASDRIDVIAVEQDAAAMLTLGGQSAVVVTDSARMVNAASHESGPLTGSLTVSTRDDPQGQGQPIVVVTGAGNTAVRVIDQNDEATVYAGELAVGSELTTTGLGSVTVRDLASPLVNSAVQQSVVTLARRGGSDPFTFQVNSSTAIIIQNGTALANDVIRLGDGGALTLTGLVADVDAREASGAITITTASGAALDVALGTGQSGDNRINSDSGAIAVDARALVEVGSTNSRLILNGTSSYVVRGLRGQLDGSSLPDAASVDVYLFDADLATDSNSPSLTYTGQIETGRGDDSLYFHHEMAGGDRAITPVAGARFDLGAGQNEVHVGRGVAVEGVFDLRGATFQLTDGGALTLVISNSRSVMLSSAQLQAGASAEAVFTDIRQAHDEPATALLEAPSGSATVRVDTTDGALTGGFQLDPSIRYWQIGIEGGGNNDVRLGNNSQSILFGTAGANTVRLNGRSSGDLVGVDILNVSGGGSIAGASVISQPGASGTLDGVIVDFDDQRAQLRLTTMQHASLETGGSSSVVNTLFVEQTMIFANRILDRGLVDGFVPQVRGVDGIERYELSSEALTDVQPALIRSRVGGLAIATDTADSPNALRAVNDFTQGGVAHILGSTGSDAIRTAGSDALRGALTVDLVAGGQDLVFVNNTNWGNFLGGSIGGGLGGAIVDVGGEFGNAASLDATIALWPGVGAGTQAASINGFSAAGSAPDRLAFVNDRGDAVGNPGFTNDIAGLLAGQLSANQVLEFSAAFTDDATKAWGDINDATALDQVARLLAANVVGPQVENGLYYVMLYSDRSATADAWLYAAVATEGDGFDFAQTGTVEVDRDTVELIAVFSGVGANSFSESNLADFAGQLPPEPFLTIDYPVTLIPPDPNFFFV